MVLFARLYPKLNIEPLRSPRLYNKTQSVQIPQGQKTFHPFKTKAPGSQR